MEPQNLEHEIDNLLPPMPAAGRRQAESAPGAAARLRTMGKRNYLIEGVSGTGKTSVAEELQRRGYHVLHGDRELKYRGDPKTGEPVDEHVHESEMDKAVWQQEHHLWDIDKVKSVIADHSKAISFFCGGSRNFSKGEIYSVWLIPG